MQENNWQILNERNVYDNNWISVSHYDVINPNGGKGIYGKVSFKNFAIGIIPIDNEGYTWLVGQQRFPLNEYSWEIPEGGCPLNDLPINAAKKELLEETGLIAENWQFLKKMHLSNSVSDEVGYLFLATDLTHHKPEPEETELLQLKKVKVLEAISMMEKGQITDVISIVALQQIKIMWLEKKIKL